MFGFFKRLFRKNRAPQHIHVGNTYQGQVIIKTGDGPLTVTRPELTISADWFNARLAASFDTEIQSKYIPELHQDHDFERRELLDIIDFAAYRSRCLRNVGAAQEALARFQIQFEALGNAMEAQGVRWVKPAPPFRTAVEETAAGLGALRDGIGLIQGLWDLPGYTLLGRLAELKPVGYAAHAPTRLRRNDWKDLLDRPLSDHFQLISLSSAHDQVYSELQALNDQVALFRSGIHHKIIAGSAGSGKTHMSALLIEKARASGDQVLFLKAKQFSGELGDLESALLRLWNIPFGYRYEEVLAELNAYAAAAGCRCLLIIDALNETTRATNGFSDIWRNHLPTLINKVTQYPHLYLVTTLRTSYIPDIWDVRPAGIAELPGFGSERDIIRACEKYFRYYRIRPRNLHSADLRLFSKPLLLDLFCKLLNEDRQEEKVVTLGAETYLNIFAGYTEHVIAEVKRRLGLQMGTPVQDGLRESSQRFLATNDAVLALDDFSTSFDPDTRVTTDRSIAHAVLEGYLLFIRDSVGRAEIVKHTQQEVGGYLLAQMLSEQYADLDALAADAGFREKIIGTDPARQHQLRLDILKFLIALRPGLILRLNDPDSLELAWWYVYNGYDGRDGAISAYLLTATPPALILDAALPASVASWTAAEAPVNFGLIAELLARLSQWDLDMTWTYYTHLHAHDLGSFVQGQTRRLLRDERLLDAQETLIARIIAFVTATTVRELRDGATVYLIEFGRRWPLLLTELAEYAATVPDSYIFERVIAANYGVALIRQYEGEYQQELLPEIAGRLVRLCFPPEGPPPSYNYIALDAVRHLAALAVHVGAWGELPVMALDLGSWTAPTEAEAAIIADSAEMDPPEPLGMDFGIYTIPRLVNDEFNRDDDARSQIYHRIFELGYQDLSAEKSSDERFREFFGGNYGQGEGKIDRLGKKYSWKAFFDYAGVLLERGQLPGDPDESETPVYERLSDVDIDISMPRTDHAVELRIHPEGLLDGRAENPEWYLADRTDIYAPYIDYMIDGLPYVLLHGSIDEKADEAYKVRSYVMTEAHLIVKNKHLDRLRGLTNKGREDWNRDIHYSPDSIRHTYFGELYWGDTIALRPREQLTVATGLTRKRKHILRPMDIFRVDSEYTREDIGREVEIDAEEQLRFESEPALADYLWETDSKTFAGSNTYVPSVRMGKYFGLKADPATGTIFDDQGPCFRRVSFSDGVVSNELYYMRADLVEQYLATHDLAILHQVKQHSYDLDQRGKRFMRYFLRE
jgi:hypothetical protein